jgi:hypothetical protein
MKGTIKWTNGKTRAQPGWFKSYEAKLLPLIEARNKACAQVFKKRTRACSECLKTARKKLKSAVMSSKNAWISKQCDTINTSFAARNGTKEAWDTLGKLRDGLVKTRPAANMKMKKPDGSTCVTAEENAGVFYDHFDKLYGRTPTYDDSVLNLLNDQPVVPGYDHTPSDKEIKIATRKLRNKAPGDSGLCPQAWKALIDTDETFAFLKKVVDFWENEKTPNE